MHSDCGADKRRPPITYRFEVRRCLGDVGALRRVWHHKPAIEFQGMVSRGKHGATVDHRRRIEARSSVA
jgi:hypothetical protein